ncbi:MAG: hypothetical protein LH603_20780 [Pseudonocardia sp.]|nr:hypothetical protein [Pseudonocardia sp.]
MADLAVDLDGLASLGANLDRARDQLDSTLAAMRDVGSAPLGTEDLDRACAEFQRSWEYGLSKLGECIGMIRTGIDGTAGSYAEVERALSEGFARMSDAQGQGT